MHKKTEADLMALARTILALNKNTDISILKSNAQQIYEQLCVLAYLKSAEADKKIAVVKTESEKPEAIEVETLFSIEEEMGVTADLEDIFIKKETLFVSEIKHETINISGTLKDKIEAAKQIENKNFENGENTTAETAIQETLNSQSKPKASLNDSLLQKGFSIDLNDRIALVKHLFEGSQEDFNRVLSQLNTFDSEQDAKDFILNQVKPDYSWQEKEVHEERFMLLIERKFI
jgi:hypothetical protein